MEASELKRWMKAHDKTAIDIASALKIHPMTVRRFLDGNRVLPSIKAALERLVASTSTSNGDGDGPKAA